MVSLEVIALVFTGLSLSASILYYSYTIQSQNKTRRLQIVKDLWEWISDEEGYQKFVQLMTMTWSDYEDFHKKYGTLTNTESYATQFSVWNKMNGLGYMVKEGVIDVETVYDHSAGRIVWMWMKFESVILEIRKENTIGYLFKWWEYLIGELLKEAEKRGEHLILPESFTSTPRT